MCHSLPKAILVVVVALSACTPGPYRTEIQDFANASSAFAAAAGSFRDEIAAEPAELLTWRAYEDTGAAIALSDQCIRSDAGSQPCRLTVGGGSGEADELEAGAVAALTQLTRLEAYGAALATLVSEEDSDALEAEKAQLATAIAALVGDVVPGAETALDAVQFLGRIDRDARRLGYLRDAVATVERWMPAASGELITSLQAAKVGRLSQLNARYRRIARLAERAPAGFERQRLAGVVADGAAEIRALQQVSPEQLVTSMVDAHSALATALQNPRVDRTALRERINRFEDLAGAFGAAL